MWYICTLCIMYIFLFSCNCFTCKYILVVNGATTTQKSVSFKSSEQLTNWTTGTCAADDSVIARVTLLITQMDWERERKRKKGMQSIVNWRICSECRLVFLELSLRLTLSLSFVALAPFISFSIYRTTSSAHSTTSYQVQMYSFMTRFFFPLPPWV